ncbi:MAG: LysM peptidoglycan-binding domain-containing protein, partial [Cellvibrionales bacterium]|nr:LysM peptidoglycan-binding domain-containing protein [Cellvibrionales bacterium]
MMKSKLATAIALVGLMHSSVLFALGLGDIKVSSAVNERLDAEIPLVNADGLDASQILVSLASKADFARAEVDRDYFLSSLEFTVERGESGTPILRLQTPDVVLEPYLNFLVELRWPKGRLLREYTVLLDLPNYSAAPARIITPVTASVPPDREKTKPFVRSFVPASKAPSAAPSSSSRSTNDKADSQAESAVTVRANETLWSIAKRVREEGASINQTMLALQDINPNAFINNNINLLKKGAVLRLPLGMSANRVNEQAAQQSIAEQQSDWQSGINTDLNPTLDARE